MLVDSGVVFKKAAILEVMHNDHYTTVRKSYWIQAHRGLSICLWYFYSTRMHSINQQREFYYKRVLFITNKCCLLNFFKSKNPEKFMYSPNQHIR